MLVDGSFLWIVDDEGGSRGGGSDVDEGLAVLLSLESDRGSVCVEHIGLVHRVVARLLVRPRFHSIVSFPVGDDELVERLVSCSVVVATVSEIDDVEAGRGRKRQVRSYPRRRREGERKRRLTQSFLLDSKLKRDVSPRTQPAKLLELPSRDPSRNFHP